MEYYAWNFTLVTNKKSNKTHVIINSHVLFSSLSLVFQQNNKLYEFIKFIRQCNLLDALKTIKNFHVDVSESQSRMSVLFVQSLRSMFKLFYTMCCY